MSENAFAQQLFSGLPARYDALGYLLSFGQDRVWRRAIVARIAAAQPGLVLDVATGTGGVARQIAERTEARVIGVDLTVAMLQHARHRISRHRRSDRIALAAARAEQLPFPDASFDALTFTYLLRYVRDPAATMSELARVVRPGGVVASLDFYVPPRLTARLAWWLYTRTVLPLAGGLLGGRSWLHVGRFLGPNITSHYTRFPLSATVRAWQDAGLSDVHTEVHSLGGGVVMWGRRAARP